jgi:hypothetical protein
MTAIDAFESLPIVDLAKCRVVHLPVYDCRSDLFERPCRHDGYAWGGYNSVGIGFTDADEVRKLLRRADNDDAAAVVYGADHLYVLLADNVREPGAKARIIVRVKQDEYFTWWWRTGMHPSAYDLDPPFYVKDVRKNPQLWLTRVEQLHRLGQSSKIYSGSDTWLKCGH